METLAKQADAGGWLGGRAGLEMGQGAAGTEGCEAGEWVPREGAKVYAPVQPTVQALEEDPVRETKRYERKKQNKKQEEYGDFHGRKVNKVSQGRRWSI